MADFFFLLKPVITYGEPLVAVAKYLLCICIVPGLSNLITGFPLDGGGVLPVIVWRITDNMHRVTVIAANARRFISYLFILFGAWQTFSSKFINGMWFAFIVWFLETAFARRVRQAALQGRQAGNKVPQVMNQRYIAISADSPLQIPMDNHILGGGRRTFVVTRGYETMIC